MNISAFFNYSGPDDQVEPENFVFLPKWSDDIWAKLLAYTTVRQFSSGEIIMHAGDRERALYFVSSGSLEVLVPIPKKTDLRRINVLEPGTVLGEVAFLDDSPRTATVRGLSEGQLLRLSIDAFETFAARETNLARDVLFELGRLLALRLRHALTMIGE